MLSASAHKFGGPRGIGFQYIRKGTPLPPLMDGGAQEQRLRAGTENVAAIIGMATALNIACHEMTSNSACLAKYEETLLNGLHEVGIDFLRNGGPHHLPGNVSLSIKGASGEMLLHRLDLMGIAVSTGSACDSKNPQLSHVIRAINVPQDYASGTIRISFGLCNNANDAVMIVKALQKILCVK